MTIQQFIERAIEGGWPPKNPKIGSIENAIEHMHEVVLDPEAWKAVGKVEGWKSLEDKDWMTNGWEHVDPEWTVKMHDMIEALIKGKSIEEFISTL